MPDCRTSHLVDFFDRVAVVEHRLDREERAERADAIRDEVWTILRRHDALAESLIEKPVNEARDLRLGPFGANDFDEVQVTRRIEEVNAEEVLFEVVGTAFGEQVNRNAARVGSDDRTGPAMFFDALVEGTFDVEVFGDRLNDQIAVFDFGKVIIKVSWRYQRSELRHKERRGLRLHSRLQPTTRNPI